MCTLFENINNDGDDDFMYEKEVYDTLVELFGDAGYSIDSVKNKNVEEEKSQTG